MMGTSTPWVVVSMVFLALAAVFGTLWFVSNQNYSTLLAAYNSLKAQYDNLKAQYQGLESQYSGLQDQYSTLQSEVNELQGELANLKSQYQQLQQECHVNPTPILQVQALSLTGVSSGNPVLTLLISNPSSSGVGINGFTLGSLSCVFSTLVQIPAGTQGVQLTIKLIIQNDQFSGVSSVSSTGGMSVSGAAAVCSGTQTAQVGAQYSGYITTVNGQTYPFTVTASS